MKKNLSFNEDKQYLVLMLAGILNIIFYILYNKYTHFFANHKHIFRSIIVLIIVFSVIWGIKLLKKLLNKLFNRKKMNASSKKDNLNSNDILLSSLINNIAILSNIYVLNCHIIAKCDFLNRNQIFTNINLIVFIISINILLIFNALNLVNMKKITMIIIIGLVYMIGYFDLKIVYFATFFSIILASLTTLDKLKNIDLFCKKRHINLFTTLLNSLIDEDLNELELNGKIELVKIIITFLLIIFIIILGITDNHYLACKTINIVSKYNPTIENNSNTIIFVNGIVRIFLGIFVFILICSNKKIKSFINTVFISTNKETDLWDKGIICDYEVGTYKGLKQIHEYLYKDIYEFAGKTRDVNLAKGNFRFTNILYLENNLAIIEKMPEGSFDEIIEKYVEMNVAHPFREGNGRATRIWLDLMLKKNLNVCVDWAMVDRADYLSAMERSPVNSLEIKHLLKNALTERVDDRGVYLRGIQQSYVYEDLDRYDIEDIEK